MSKYTTEVRFICETLAGYDESQGYSKVEDIIADARPKIFDFDFPIFDESYRNVLETKIIKHYYTREIGLETYSLWKLKLDTKLNEIMPYYNRLYNSELLEFNPLYTKDYTRTTKNSGISVTQTENSSASSASGTESHTDTNDDGRARANTDLYSDTPQGQITHLEDKTYLTNARQINDSEVGHAENTGNSNTLNNSVTSANGKATGNTFDDYIERVVGYDNKVPSELLESFRKTFLNIDMMIIKDLEELFMQLW